MSACRRDFLFFRFIFWVLSISDSFGGRNTSGWLVLLLMVITGFASPRAKKAEQLSLSPTHKKFSPSPIDKYRWSYRILKVMYLLFERFFHDTLYVQKIC